MVRSGWPRWWGQGDLDGGGQDDLGGGVSPDSNYEHWWCPLNSPVMGCIYEQKSQCSILSSKDTLLLEILDPPTEGAGGGGGGVSGWVSSRERCDEGGEGLFVVKLRPTPSRLIYRSRTSWKMFICRSNTVKINDVPPTPNPQPPNP